MKDNYGYFDKGVIMNELEKICVSPEIARSLIDAGIRVKSAFFWVKVSQENKSLPKIYIETEKLRDDLEFFSHEDLLLYSTWGDNNIIKYYPAPTFVELQKHIPDKYHIDIWKNRIELWEDKLGAAYDLVNAVLKENISDGLGQILIELKKEKENKVE